MVNVFDRGEFDGTYYIAMEYVQGASLRDLINEGMSVEAAVGVTRQILAAAKFAHSHGVIHQDFKPGNVLVDREGRATGDRISGSPRRACRRCPDRIGDGDGAVPLARAGAGTRGDRRVRPARSG